MLNRRININLQNFLTKSWTEFFDIILIYSYYNNKYKEEDLKEENNEGTYND